MRANSLLMRSLAGHICHSESSGPVSPHMPCTCTCNMCLLHSFHVCAQMEAATTELSNSLQEESEANCQILQDMYTKVNCRKDQTEAWRSDSPCCCILLHVSASEALRMGAVLTTMVADLLQPATGADAEAVRQGGGAVVPLLSGWHSPGGAAGHRRADPK